MAASPSELVEIQVAPAARPGLAGESELLVDRYVFVPSCIDDDRHSAFSRSQGPIFERPENIFLKS
jgi:hypothetical protein